MRLINLKVAGIRGFNIEQEFELDDDLVIIYGPNGQGKTSFAEIIEYLFFGTIYKKENACSKIEFKDTIKNIHFDGTPFVESIIKIDNDNKTIRREYISETESRVLIDNVSFDNLNSLIKQSQDKPIIYQHGLQSFINTSPVERYNQFMKLLGIEKLDIFLKVATKKFNEFKINKLEEEFKENISKLKEFRDSKLSELIDSHKAKIIEWYDLLNPNEEIRICDIECNGSKINFIASCFGVNKYAVPILSEAHLNCLGLSIYLSQIVDSNNSFSFILIDDPVQSMDDAHTNNFISNIIEKLLTKNIQVYIMSHLKQSVSDVVITRYKHKLPKYIEFYGFCLEGPKFTIKASNHFEDYINQAKETFNGTSEQRKTCANMIRQAVESYTKLYYKKRSGNTIPNDCKKAQFSILDSKLLTRIDIDSDEKGKLRMINGKCDKRSHDDEMTEIPTSGGLKSFIDILEGLYKKHIK